MAAWIAIGLVFAVGSAAVTLGILLWVRLSGYRRVTRHAEAPTDGFTPARYEPMTRLLDGADLDFLRKEAACGSDLAARWERSRRRIFRMYLRDLAEDFRRVHAEARALVAESPERYSALVGVLMRQQLTFWRALAAVELRLALNGLGAGPADVRGLVEAIEAIRAEMVRIAAVPASA
jgi:hypothetical protein